MSAIEFARTKMTAFYKKIAPRIQNPIGRRYFTVIFDIFLQHPDTHGKTLVDLVERLPHFFSPQIVAETKEHVRVVTDYLKNTHSVHHERHFSADDYNALRTLAQYVGKNQNMLEPVLNMIRAGHMCQCQPPQFTETMVLTDRGWVPDRQINPVTPPVSATPSFKPMQPHAPLQKNEWWTDPEFLEKKSVVYVRTLYVSAVDANVRVKLVSRDSYLKVEETLSKLMGFIRFTRDAHGEIVFHLSNNDSLNPFELYDADKYQPAATRITLTEILPNDRLCETSTTYILRTVLGTKSGI